MYKAYIEPDLKTAHLKIYNTFNPFSGFMDPTYILKSAKRVSKEVINSLLKVCALLSSSWDLVTPSAVQHGSLLSLLSLLVTGPQGPLGQPCPKLDKTSHVIPPSPASHRRYQHICQGMIHMSCA